MNRIPKNKLTKLQPPTVLQRYKKYIGGKTASSTNSAGKTGSSHVEETGFPLSSGTKVIPFKTDQ